MLLVLDGAYLVGTEPPVFRRVRRREDLRALVERLAERIRGALERRVFRGERLASAAMSAPT